VLKDKQNAKTEGPIESVTNSIATRIIDIIIRENANLVTIILNNNFGTRSSIDSQRYRIIDGLLQELESITNSQKENSKQNPESK
jgi:hypothetical protein